MDLSKFISGEDKDEKKIVHKKKRIIIAANYGGMCNRLKGWISVLRIALNSKPQMTPKLYWPKNDLCGCNFKDLFWNSPWEVNGIQGYDKDKNIDVIDTWRFITFEGDEIKRDFAKVYPLKNGNGKDIDFEYDRIPQGIRDSILLYLNELKPIENISKSVEEYSKKFDITNRIGVHVRRGDFKTLDDGRGKISTNEDFFKRMDELIKENPEVKFYLTTDGIEVEKEYKERYKDKIISCPRVNQERDRDSVLAAQEALIDLLLLSKTKHILGTYLSSFTEMAWWFGNCNAKIEIMGDHKIKEKEKVIKNLHGRGFVCVTKFWNGIIRRVKQN